MDFGKVAANPLVWGGGLAIGLVLVLARGGGAQASTGVTGYSSAELQATGAYNALAFRSVEAQAANATQLGIASLNADVSKQASLLSYMKSLSDNRTVLADRQMQSQSGIAQAQIASSTAIILDQQNNSNRLQLSWVEADVQKTSIAAQLEGVKYQARYGAKAAKYGAIGSVVSSLGNTAIKAFAGGK